MSTVPFLSLLATRHVRVNDKKRDALSLIRIICTINIIK